MCYILKVRIWDFVLTGPLIIKLGSFNQKSVSKVANKVEAVDNIVCNSRDNLSNEHNFVI